MKFSDNDELRNLLAAIVESSDDAIISKDLNGIVTSWNRAAEQIFGYTAAEMIGQPISVIAASDRKNEMPLILERIRRGERVDHYETVRRKKSGELIDISLTVSPIYDGTGRLVGASKISRDITERKRAEKALAMQAEQLARSNAELQQFAFVTSHDLQEPLRTIASFSDLLRQRYKGRLDPEADEIIGFVIDSATRMSEQIRDLLSYSRATDVDDFQFAPVRLSEVVERAIDNLHIAVRESGATIEIGELPEIPVDRISFVQVFQNLLSNAMKYRSELPLQIRISSEQNGSDCVIAVTDNGLGIPERYRQTVFGLFKRLHGNKYPGTGIGLALCKKIVEKHGGRIWVEGASGGGSTFRFTLPRGDNGD